jgi:hypothetical protein
MHAGLGGEVLFGWPSVYGADVVGTVSCKAEEEKGELGSRRYTERRREVGKGRSLRRQPSALLSGAGDDGELH